MLGNNKLSDGRSRHGSRLPGVGPMSAMEVAAFCPPAKNFRSGRDFAAWLSLVRRQHSTGGK
ncbi:transposase [Falsiruegeria mediterranea]|uniref:transposase n=1 Tax=Falsiruegeria mediterranea TaxID=1280832 RepID=UPI002286DC1D|nr:transposase [Falsiruegeria mediterranea]